MDDQYIGLVVGGTHLVLSFVLAIASTYGSFRIFDFLTKDINENEELNANNIAVAVVLSGMLLSAAIVVKQVLSPAMSTFETFLYDGFSVAALAQFIGYFLGYLAGTLLITVIAIWLAIISFLKLTRDIDEFAEIKKGNIAVALVLAISIVIMGYFLADGIKTLLDAVVPFPSSIDIEIMQ